MMGCRPAVKIDGGVGKTRGILSEALPATPPEGALILLDEGGDTTRWRHEKAPKEPLRWDCSDGVLTIVPGTGSIVTKEALSDFRLHLEFNINAPVDGAEPDGNSGLYLQRRYELQILDPAAKAKKPFRCGAIYGERAADRDAARPAGEWQTYDLVFRAARWRGEEKTENARLTAYLNGVLIHGDAPIPGTTGSGREEGPDAQPLKLQDHGNAVSFRNIWLVPLVLD